VDKTPETIVSEYESCYDEKMFKRKYAMALKTWISHLTQRGDLLEATINLRVCTVKNFFKYNDLPLGLVPQARKKVTFHNRDIEKEEIVRILNVSTPRDKAFFAVMAQSGLRPDTIAHLRIKDLEPDLSQNRVPCKIEVRQENTKGKYASYISFIGEEALRLLKDYLNTRPNLKPESFLFTAHGLEKSLHRATASKAFMYAARKLKEKGILNYEIQQEGKPSELRLYNLRKFFRKHAAQAGFENTEYWMGHTGGVDGHYRPKDTEFYRQIYAEKAMPHLRLEMATPSETEKQIEELRKENALLKEKMAKIESSRESLEALLKRVEELEKKLEPKDKET
jgi:integrase